VQCIKIHDREAREVQGREKKWRSIVIALSQKGESLQEERFKRLIICSVRDSARKEKWKNVEAKFKFQLVKRKMVSKGDTVGRNLREK
jgi:hypothetical protein